MRCKMAASLPATPADLDSTKDMDGAARNSPAAKQNETACRHSNKKAKREQHSRPEISESIKQRHACPEHRCRKSDLIWRDGCSAQAQNKPIFNRCMYDGREIEDMFLRHIQQQPFGQSAVLRRRSRKENR